MSTQTPSERRVCERVRYPQELRPTVIINGVENPLVEISEAGIVFTSNDDRYRICQPFVARIVFFERGTVEVEGVVLRMQSDEVIAACLTKHVPVEVLQHEIQYLARFATLTTEEQARERRRHSRLRYPEHLRPMITVKGVEWPVVDISATGLVFLSRDLSYRLRQPFNGTVRFFDGGEAVVEGTILRMTSDYVIASCLKHPLDPVRLEREKTLVATGKPAEIADEKGHERRRHERIRFPEGARPTVMIRGAEWPVVEISQGGFVFLSQDLRYRLKQPFMAWLRFIDGGVVPVEGQILRMTKEMVIASCPSKMIPKTRVEIEKGYLAGNVK